MANDVDVKTSISEEEHDDLLITARQYGFKNRAEIIRWLIRRELAWAKPQLQINRSPGAFTGRD